MEQETDRTLSATLVFVTTAPDWGRGRSFGGRVGIPSSPGFSALDHPLPSATVLLLLLLACSCCCVRCCCPDRRSRKILVQPVKPR